jgi:hypothetical protein
MDGLEARSLALYAHYRHTKGNVVVSQLPLPLINY